MIKVVLHSGMNFIIDNTFEIEKSPEYIQIGKDIKTVEFIRALESKLLFVEAKSSFPNPNNPNPNPEKDNKTGKELFREEVEKICEKFVHSLNLYSSIAIGINGDGFPPDYMPSKKVSLDFVLVINGFQKSWCDEIKRALMNKICKSDSMTRIWKPQVFVMNHEDAQKCNIVHQNSDVEG